MNDEWKVASVTFPKALRLKKQEAETMTESKVNPC